MDKHELRQLVYQPRETAKLDFKIKFYKIYEPEHKDKQWAELIKDIIALANGNIGTAGQTGYLIIGADDKLKTDNTPNLQEVSGELPDRTTILNKVNKYCDPPLPDLKCEKIKIDGINLFVISIPYFSYLFRIAKSKQLITNKVYSAYTVLVRRHDGESTYEASPEEQEHIRRERSLGTLPPSDYTRFSREKIREFSKKNLKQKAWKGFMLTGLGVVLLISVIFIFFNLFLSSFSILFYIGILFGTVLICHFYFSGPSSQEMCLYLRRPKVANMSIFIDQGKFSGNFIEDSGDGNYAILKPLAKCIYHYCEGEILITNAPPRERSRLSKSFVGICSVSGRDHSYRVDHNLVATKEKFDWGPLEKK
jgi:Putative DNA-binding domain